MDLYGFLGFYADKAALFADSGYVTSSMPVRFSGCCLLAVCIALSRRRYTAQRRLAQALPIFMFFNLMIGATPVFTAKIAGLLWLLVGHARQQTAPRDLSLSQAANTALPRQSFERLDYP